MFACTVLTENRGHIVVLTDGGSFIKTHIYGGHAAVVTAGSRVQMDTDRHGEFYINAVGSIVEVPDTESFPRAEGVVKMHNLDRGFGFIKSKTGDDLHFSVEEIEYGLMARNLTGLTLSYMVAKTSAKGHTAVFVKNVQGQKLPERG